MTDRLLMEIADVSISIQSRHSQIQRNIFPAYQHFLSGPGHLSGHIDLEIDLETDGLIDTSGMRKIFDSEQSWSMYSDGDEFVLLMKPPAFPEPLWVARFDSSFTRVKIFFGRTCPGSENGGVTMFNPVCYPLDQIMLMYHLSKKNGALVHAAGIGVSGRGCIFPGRSGAGKSTLSRQFLYRTDAELLSDDRIILRKIDNTFKSFGTPWPGDAGIAENKSFPLCGIFFIHHSDECMIKDIKPREAIERLMPVTSIPWYDEKIMSEILSFCEDLAENVPAYELYFRPDNEVVDFLEEFVSA